MIGAEEFKHTVARRIIKLRFERGMTAKQLADKLFVSAQTVRNWEKAKYEFTARDAVALAEVFGVDVKEIVGDWRTKGNVNR